MLLVAAPASALVCNVTAQGVAFGAYDTLNASATEGVGNVQVICLTPVSFTVSLDSGSGSYAQRMMSGGAGQLGYNLYTDSSRTTVWGDGLGATSNVSASGILVDLPVYGRIPARQNVGAASYADSITVTVTY
jgi:spore coat protein U-like protein